MFDNEQEWKEKFDEAVKAQQENKYDYAEHTWMVAVEEAEALGPNDQRLALTLDRLCEFLLLRGKLQEAASYGYRALAIYEEALGENADELASILANLAMLAKTNNNKIEAERLYRRALAVNSRVLGSSEPRVKTLLNEFAMVLESLGRKDEADQLRGVRKKDGGASLGGIPAFRTGFTSGPQKKIQSPAQNVDPIQQSGAFKTLNHLMGSSTNHPTFKPASQASPTPPGTATPQKSQSGEIDFKTLKIEADTALTSGNNEQARALFQEFIDRTAKEDRMTPDYCYALESLAKIHTREYNYQEATVYLEESLDIKSRVLGADHALVGALKSDLARCYYTIKDYTKAETLARSCVDVYTQAYGEGSLELANAWHNLGTLYHVQEKYDSAGECYQKSLPVKKRLLGETHQETIKLKNAIANLESSLAKIRNQANPQEESSEISGAWRAIPITETKPGWWKEDLFGEE